MIIIQNISAPPGTTEAELCEKALKTAGLSRSGISCGLHKISLDARRRNDIHLVASVWVRTDPALERQLSSRKDIVYAEETPFEIPAAKKGLRVVIAGFGPAGMFAAYVLAKAGLRPVVLERGAAMEKRIACVERFAATGQLDPRSNVQFGEGGAGTFSDGKLTTRIKDPLCRFVLETLAAHGAPEEILTRAKPHVGTDRLRGVVKRIREDILAMGGDIRFESTLTDISVTGGAISAVQVNGEYDIPCDALILATGHSAHDTVDMLLSRGADIIPKPFSIGVRIEHTRQQIDESLYGEYAGDPLLPAGEYQLSNTRTERGVYTFCMCPGGVVMASQSEDGSIVTNGCSDFARNGTNSNSALLVSVTPKDYDGTPTGGIKLAKSIEQAAYKAGAGIHAHYAPATTVDGLFEGKGTLKGATVVPTYAPGVCECRFDDIFPPYITEGLKTGLSDFGRKMKAFGDMGAVLTAPETRSSSPVRILRTENRVSEKIQGLYPCGEGAGYAGGIMSAAVDGINTAKAELMK